MDDRSTARRAAAVITCGGCSAGGSPAERLRPATDLVEQVGR